MSEKSVLKMLRLAFQYRAYSRRKHTYVLRATAIVRFRFPFCTRNRPLRLSYVYLFNLRIINYITLPVNALIIRRLLIHRPLRSVAFN